jgi:predicted dehydrogenase
MMTIASGPVEVSERASRVGDWPPGLVIGYGSIGRRHAETLGRRCRSLAIVNRRPEVRARASADHPHAWVAPDLESLDARGFPWADAMAVIATWGPSHAAFFHALADRGVRRILCEKPMADSVVAAAEMLERARRDGIVLGVNQVLRHTGLVPALRTLAAEHGVGEPVQIVVRGGASCLVTNGVHWVDVAIQLFEAAPERVVSTAGGEAINPRDATLRFYGGTAVWSFAHGREAVLSLSNHSSVFPTVTIYYRDAAADVALVPAADGDVAWHVVLRRRDPELVQRWPAVTRTGAAGEVVHAGPLSGTLGFAAALAAAPADVAGDGAPAVDGDVGLAAVHAVIGALAGGRDRIAIALPIPLHSRHAIEPWPIS